MNKRMQNKKIIPANSLRRMTKYLKKLDILHNKGIIRVSSATLGRMLGLTSSQIRQDMNCYGVLGCRGYGYDVDELRSTLGDVLGVSTPARAIIVGIGNIGQVLIQSFDFSACGVEVVAAFDTKSKLQQKQSNTIPIYEYDQIDNFLADNTTEVGVLCVAECVAQSVAEKLIEYGIKAIWNFSNVDLSLPGDVTIENIHFTDSLLALKYYACAKNNC